MSCIISACCQKRSRLNMGCFMYSDITMTSEVLKAIAKQFTLLRNIRRKDIVNNKPYPFETKFPGETKAECAAGCGTVAVFANVSKQGWKECKSGCLELVCNKCADVAFIDGNCRLCNEEHFQNSSSMTSCSSSSLRWIKEEQKKQSPPAQTKQ